MKFKKRIDTSTFFNLGTQRALYEKVDGYIKKEVYMSDHVKEIERKYKPARIVRMDLGQNNDGCDVGILELLEDRLLKENKRHYLKNYPEFVCRELREKVAGLHNINPDWIFLSAGLEQTIMMIASTFLDLNDKFLINNPSFFLFEEYSKRMGAVAIRLNLYEEEDFDWTRRVFDEYTKILNMLRPKLIWIANPNNPTGREIRKDFIRDIIKEARDHYAFVVVDEAYGQYIDPPGGVNSASEFLNEFNNLIVLRTFSKAYGLANVRVGFAMCSDTDILNALRIHKTNFPISQLSFDLADAALQRLDYLNTVRKNVLKRKNYLISEFNTIPDIEFIDTNTNIMMISLKKYTAYDFALKLEQHGVITAPVPGDSEASDKYIRITLSTEDENEYLIETIRRITGRMTEKKSLNQEGDNREVILYS